MSSSSGEDVGTSPHSAADRVVRVAGLVLGASLIVLALSGAPLVWKYRPSIVGMPWDRGVHRVSATIALWAAVIWALASAGRTIAERRRSEGARGNAFGAWMTAAAVVLIVIASVTGFLLPWDQLALWAVTVGTNIRGVDDAAFSDGIRFVLINGTEISQGTYRFWTIVHTVLLPVALAVTFGVRWRIRTRGATRNVS
ncbi:MAG: menaquinol-cytochrome c reductase cytochrome b subunit [Actinomycetota bacterium]|jgi:hypothetical protein